MQPDRHSVPSARFFVLFLVARGQSAQRSRACHSIPDSLRKSPAVASRCGRNSRRISPRRVASSGRLAAVTGISSPAMPRSIPTIFASASTSHATELPAQTARVREPICRTVISSNAKPANSSAPCRQKQRSKKFGSSFRIRGPKNGTTKTELFSMNSSRRLLHEQGRGLDFFFAPIIRSISQLLLKCSPPRRLGLSLPAPRGPKSYPQSFRFVPRAINR